ncbi:TonB family protein [Hyphomicrobium sp.]|jgi:protein TonB|uniref:energy transducer TonB n=1 Tax=Hyphomicrobium sp. TaxID=82 RepID=UPI002B6275CC|nr:TonB family protein [Hyphomicrobium sp.]HVZ03787.1 TonB family protein [Hyphomicrobium sp.]
MLVRTLAILLSALMHGLIGYAIWPSLANERLEVLDLGKGPDIVLAPQGMVMSEVSNLGDDVQTIETRDVVPLDQQKPPPAAPSVTPPEQLRNVVGNIEDKKMPEAVAIPAQKSSLKPPAALPAEQLPDVVTAEASAIEQEVSQARKPPPDPVQQPAVVQADKPAPPDALQQPNEVNADAVPAPKQIGEPEAASADVPTAPTQSTDKAVAKADLPPPDELKEPKVAEADAASTPKQLSDSAITKADLPLPDQLKEPKATAANEPSYVETAEQPKPNLEEAISQPEEVAIVSELSSGEAKTGGDAHAVGLYLGKINARIQHSKVNPHSQHTGRVILKFTIGTDGSLLSKQVVSSSGSRVLDEAALAAIDRAAPFPAVPAAVSLKPMVFSQPFNFIIR